jgi:hypothetical protein
MGQDRPPEGPVPSARERPASWGRLGRPRPPIPRCRGGLRRPALGDWAKLTRAPDPSPSGGLLWASGRGCDGVRAFRGFAKPAKKGRQYPRANGGWGAAHFETAPGTPQRGGGVPPVGGPGEMDLRRMAMSLIVQRGRGRALGRGCPNIAWGRSIGRLRSGFGV